jgi:hypothetical protein
MTEKNVLDSLAHILIETHLVEQEELDEALDTSKRLDVPLERALIMHKHATDQSLQAVLLANELVKESKITVPVAIQAIELSRKDNIDIKEAINIIGIALSKSQKLPSSANILADLFLTTQTVSQEQLLGAIEKAQATNMSIGCILVLNRSISRFILHEALTVLWLYKEEKISRNQAEQAFRGCRRRKVSAVQILFELGQYNDSSGQTLRLFEFIQMAGLLPEGDFLDCWEMSICNEKPYGEVLIDQKMITPQLLEAALTLLEMIGDYLKPFQAAEALRQVRLRDVPTYQAIAELHPPPQLPQRELRLGELIAEAGLLSREVIEKTLADTEEGAVRIGKHLITLGLLSETSLYKTLRCQSLYREGMLSADQTIALLQACKGETATIEDALHKAGWYVPARVHWSWV